MQNPPILGISVLQIGWCGWEFVFLQNLCRTRSSLEQVLVVLSPNSLDLASNSVCVFLCMESSLQAPALQVAVFLSFLSLLRAGPKRLICSSEVF